MELTEIKSKGVNWGKTAQSLNNNFEKIDADVEKLKNATMRNKGYFSTSSELISAFPTASKGDIAYVGSSYPYDIWKWNGSSWANSGSTGGEESVNLGNYHTAGYVDEKLSELWTDAFPLVSGVEGAMYAEAHKGGYSYFGHGAARLAARKGYESILVGGLALNCNTGTDFIKKYDNQDFWADFIVADGDVTLPEGLDCEGNVLHVRIKGTHKVKSAGNYPIFKSKSSSSVSEVEYEDASVTFICCVSAWYEF